MSKISAAIVVKDSPPHLLEAVASLIDFVDEVVIFDIGMNHQLKNYLLKEKKIKFVEIKRDIPYVELIREEEKKYLKHNWVLYLDPDEIFPKETFSVIKKEIENYDCFSFPRKNIIFGQFIKYSRFWPDYQTRLFKKDKVFWPKKIHSQPEIKGKEYSFLPKEQYAILHYNYENLDQWFEKYLRYAKSEAQYYIDKKKNLDFLTISKKSLSELISRYFASEGYKDGFVGLILAILQMFYYFVVYFYFWEKREYKVSEIERDLPIKIHNFFNEGQKETLYWLREKKITKGFHLIKDWLKRIIDISHFA